jgi:type VI protein secretion system component Hcp
MPELVLVFVCTLFLAPVRLGAQGYAAMQVVGSQQGVIRGSTPIDPTKRLPAEWIPVQRATLVAQAASPTMTSATQPGYLHLVKSWDVGSPLLEKALRRGDLLEVTLDWFRGDQLAQKLTAKSASILAIAHRYDGASAVEELWLSYSAIQKNPATSTTPAASAATLCAQLQGKTIGVIQGDCSDRFHMGWTVIQEFEPSVRAALQPEAFKVVKQQDATSPLLLRAMQRGELLNAVTVNFYDLSLGNPLREILTLQNARISNIAQSSQGTNLVEEITFSYRNALQTDFGRSGNLQQSVRWNVQGGFVF